MSEKKIGEVRIKILRSQYEPNWKVYFILPTQFKNLGEFDVDQWDYAYTLKASDIDITEIQEAKKLPPKLERVKVACMKVLNETWFGYEMLLLSKQTKNDVEWELEHWLKEEGYQKVIVVPVKLSKVKSVERIPITEAMLQKVLEKHRREKKEVTVS